MTKIIYSLFDSQAQWRDYSPEDSAILNISFKGASGGTLYIFGQSLSVKNGEVTVNIRQLEDGVYRGKLHTGDGIYILEPIQIKDGIPSPTPTEEATVRRMAERIEELTRTVSELTGRTDELWELVKGYPLFK